MRIMSYTTIRNNLAKIMKKVHDDHVPVIITRHNGEACEETAYLMQSSHNVARLTAAIEELESGKGKKRDIIKE